MQTLMIAEDRESLIPALSQVLNEISGCIAIASCTPEEIGDHIQTFPRIIYAIPSLQDAVICLLRMLQIPSQTAGYKQLAVAIPIYLQDSGQCFSKELYPAVAVKLGVSNGAAVEHSIRNAIRGAWKHRDPQIWDILFLDGRKPPSNSRFISTLAELLK